MTCTRSRQSRTPPVVRAGTLQVPLAYEEPAPVPTGDAQFVPQPKLKVPGNVGLLFEQYSRVVRGTAYRVLGDPSEAEEVVQEVFFYLCRKPQLFDETKGSLKGWIIQIALSRALDRKLYLARRRPYANESIATLHQCPKDLDQEIDTKLTRKHLERAFSTLSDRQRRTIEFFYFEEMDLREISEYLGEPLGSVRHHLYRGLERLRKSSVLRRLRL